MRYRDDEHIELDGNAAERAVRAVALGRENFLFFAGRMPAELAACVPRQSKA